MAFPSRDLHGPAQSRAVRDLFQSLFVAELHPSEPQAWLFFAWISRRRDHRQFGATVCCARAGLAGSADPPVPGLARPAERAAFKSGWSSARMATMTISLPASRSSKRATATRSSGPSRRASTPRACSAPTIS